MNQRILIAFFSGTGCTRMVAEQTARQVEKRGYAAELFDIDETEKQTERTRMETALAEADRLILAYVVHAVDAPDPVYTWIEGIRGRAIPTAVISVSGGGEVWPNTVCRQNCIAALERKGFTVSWEDMIVMPCNMIFSYGDDLHAHLLAALPGKLGLVLDGFLAGGTRRLPRRKPDPIQKAFPIKQKKNIHLFARTIRVTNDCAECGWCAKNCPVGNISAEKGKPVFGDTCIGCLRCVYGCPKGALRSKNFLVIKKGFDMREIARKAAESYGIDMNGDGSLTESAIPVDYGKLTRGPLFSGVRKYLDELSGERETAR